MDLHCDTLYEIFVNHKSPKDSSLAICMDPSLQYPYQSYTQVADIWSAKELSDDQAFDQCLSVLDTLRSHPIGSCVYEIGIHDAKQFFEAPKKFILGVEDARLLAGDIQRLTVLRKKGVRFLTLFWKGLSCIGGAYDTNIGLSDFGKTVVTRYGVAVITITEVVVAEIT